MGETITPALNLEENLPNTTAADFQNQLYSWFEDKGVMEDLRTHLRVKMIGLLKESPAVTNTGRKSISPKLQAVNLLIAEYLLYKEYHYSLSVFSTEVRLNNAFQNYSVENGPKKYEFAKEDMWDILEIIGITNDSEEGKGINEMYYSDEISEPLLTCIIRILHKTKSQTKIIHMKPENNDNNYIIKNISDVLVQANINPDYISSITEQFSQIIKTEVDRLKLEKKKQYQEIKQKLQVDSKNKIDKCKRRVVSLERTFSAERIRLQTELDRAKCDLKECALSLQSRTDKLLEREFLVGEREQLVLHKEKLVSERQSELDSKEVLLGQREERLHSDLQAIYIDKLKLGELKRRTCNGNCVKRSDKEQKLDQAQQTVNPDNLEHVMLNQNNTQLQLEIEMLRSQNSTQNAKILELTQRIENLLVQADVTRTRNVINNSNNHNESLPGNNNEPLLVGPTLPMLSLNTLRNYSFNGGGDKVNRFRSSPPVFRNTNNRLARTNLEFEPPLSSNSSSNDSPTENVLNSARNRLRNLERESDEIERNYNQFKSKSLGGHAASCYNSQNNKTAETTNENNLVNKLDINIAAVRENISRIVFGNCGKYEELCKLSEYNTGELYEPEISANMTYLYACEVNEDSNLLEEELEGGNYNGGQEATRGMPFETCYGSLIADIVVEDYRDEEMAEEIPEGKNEGENLDEGDNLDEEEENYIINGQDQE